MEYDIVKLEKALDIKLFPEVINYLNNKEYNFEGRRCGKTTAYIIKTVLETKHTISIRALELGYYNDERHDPNYIRWFLREFMDIRSRLKDGGFEVVDVRRVICRNLIM